MPAQEPAAPATDTSVQGRDVTIRPMVADSEPEQDTKGITIVKALYGSGDQFASGTALDVTDKAKKDVIDGKLPIQHTRQAFGDRHPYRDRHLMVPKF